MNSPPLHHSSIKSLPSIPTLIAGRQEVDLVRGYDIMHTSNFSFNVKDQGVRTADVNYNWYRGSHCSHRIVYPDEGKTLDI